MELSKDSLLVLASAPLVLVLVAVEILVSHLRHRPAYTVRGMLTNVYLAAANVGLDVSMRGIWFAAMSWGYRTVTAGVASSRSGNPKRGCRRAGAA